MFFIVGGNTLFLSVCWGQYSIFQYRRAHNSFPYFGGSFITSLKSKDKRRKKENSSIFQPKDAICTFFSIEQPVALVLAGYL